MVPVPVNLKIMSNLYPRNRIQDARIHPTGGFYLAAYPARPKHLQTKMSLFFDPAPLISSKMRTSLSRQASSNRQPKVEPAHLVF